MLKSLLLSVAVTALMAAAAGCDLYATGPAVVSPGLVVGPSFYHPYYYGGYGYHGYYGYRGYYGHGFRGRAFRGGYHGFHR